MHALLAVPNDKVLRLTMLLHDVGKPVAKTTDDNGVDHFKMHPQIGADMAVNILRRLKFDNDTIARVKRLVLWHDDRPAMNEKSVRKAIVRFSEAAFPDIFAVKRADAMAQSEIGRQEKLDYIDEFQRIYEDIMAKGQCVSKKTMAVNGKDILDLGAPQGKMVGDVLDELFKEVVSNSDLNDREYLLNEARRIIGNYGGK
jgi:tRNA nucleotidyltransferase (CCA-adding enzyme)